MNLIKRFESWLDRPRSFAAILLFTIGATMLGLALSFAAGYVVGWIMGASS